MSTQIMLVVKESHNQNVIVEIPNQKGRWNYLAAAKEISSGGSGFLLAEIVVMKGQEILASEPLEYNIKRSFCCCTGNVDDLADELNKLGCKIIRSSTQRREVGVASSSPIKHPQSNRINQDDEGAPFLDSQQNSMDTVNQRLQNGGSYGTIPIPLQKKTFSELACSATDNPLSLPRSYSKTISDLDKPHGVELTGKQLFTYTTAAQIKEANNQIDSQRTTPIL